MAPRGDSDVGCAAPMAAHPGWSSLLDQPHREPDASLAARRRQTNRLIAIGLALCIAMMFVAAIAFAVVDHSLSGHPLFQ